MPMLLISRSMGVRKIICIPFLCLIDKLSFAPLFDLKVSPLATNVFFSFPNHKGAVFFFFLLLSLPPSPPMES